MPKEAFGGDDSGGGAPEKRKIGLDKFGLSPDANIRDVFWKIMGAYAATKKPGLELKTLDNDRFALVRVALSVLSSQHGERFGLAPKFIALYSLMMVVDGGWQDALSGYLEMACERKLGIKKEVVQAMRKLLGQDRYGSEISGSLHAMVRSRSKVRVGLEYVSEMESPELVRGLKKELMIIARGDIGQNQLNAIKAISLITDDEDIKKSFIILLSHWDAQARHAASEVLVKMRKDDEVRAAAEKRLASETDEDIRNLLKRITS